MKFNKRHRTNDLTWVAGFAAPVALAFALVGCASSLTTVRMAPKLVASRLGFPTCRVSVPLSQADVIGDAKMIGNLHPEEYPEWIAITENIHAGDQLRLVDCLNAQQPDKVGGVYFYALIREDKIILKFYPMIFD
jgi:hypothetical protein